MDPTLASAVRRMLDAIGHPLDRRILGPQIKREVIFRLLLGQQGHRLRAVAARDSRSHRIAEVLRFLRASFHEPLDIAAVAHQARLLMLNDGLNAGDAPHRVGYGSPSQFSRELKHFFGAPPSRDLAFARASSP